MSDKKNISLEDRGWSEMQSLLDKELPVEKKKRRMLLWFLFGTASIAFIALLSTRDTFNFATDTKNLTTNVTINEGQKTNIEISDSEEISNQLTIVEETYNEIADNKEVKINEGSSTRTEGGVPIKEDKKNTIASKTTKLNDKTEIVQSLDPQVENEYSDKIKPALNNENDVFQNNILDKTNKPIDPVINSSQLENQGLDQLQLENQVQDKPQLKNQVQENPQLQFDRLKLEPIIQLPFVIPFLNTNQKIEPNKSIKPYASAQLKNTLSPYLFASGNYQSSLNGLGYEMGAGVDYNFNKMGIYLEVGYSRTKFGNEEIGADFSPEGAVSEIDDGPVEDVEFENNPPLFDLNVNNFSKITSSISEIKFNLGLRKNISKRLNLNAGIAYSKLFNVTNKSLSIIYEVENGLNANSFYNIRSSELQNKGAYSNFDITPHIGMEYEFLPNAYFGLNYNYGLKNLIVNTDLDKINSLSKTEAFYKRNLQAKVRYTF